MIYTVHLTTGVTVEFETGMLDDTDLATGWLIDTSGVAVKMDAVIAFVPKPVTPAEPAETQAGLPDFLIDDWGYRWERLGVGMAGDLYRCIDRPAGSVRNRRYAEIIQIRGLGR